MLTRMLQGSHRFREHGIVYGYVNEYGTAEGHPLLVAVPLCETPHPGVALAVR